MHFFEHFKKAASLMYDPVENYWLYKYTNAFKYTLKNEPSLISHLTLNFSGRNIICKV